MVSAPRNLSRAVVIAALVLVLLACQAVAEMNAPPQGTSNAGRSIGRAGFAYLGGLRTFAAAVLWNRVDPLLHEYYDGVRLEKQTYMMPTLRLVTALDPQFQQAYYVASWIAYKRVSPAAGLEIAQAGVDNNPRAGLMRANLVQLLYLQNRVKNDKVIRRNVDMILSKGPLTWADQDEYYEGLALTVQPLESEGRIRLADQVRAALSQMRAQGVGAGSHDHNGDGIQEH